MPLQMANLLELEDRARSRIPPGIFDYIAGAAEDEISLRRSREAYNRWAIRPRVLTDVSIRDTSTAVLNDKVAMPIFVAPSAFHGLVNPDGEVATAHGAAAAGTIMVASTLSTKTLEEIAASVPAPRWFQLYVVKDRRVTEDLVHRAANAGYHALCLTVDAPVAGRRERDERNALPPKTTPRNLEGTEAGRVFEKGAESTFGANFTAMLDPSLTWKDIDWLRGASPLPLVLKGIMTAEDAELAVDHGAAGVVVSNHGGRQLDGTVGTLDALPEVAAAVRGRSEVYVDGGIRRGTDVFKALALGARAVLVGRPILWGLALDGSDGVRAVLDHLRLELSTTMALAGRPRVRDIGRDAVQPAP